MLELVRRSMHTNCRRPRYAGHPRLDPGACSRSPTRVRHVLATHVRSEYGCESPRTTPDGDPPVDVVWLSDTPWRALDRRRKRMVAALQPVARVLYVEPPASMRLPCQSIQKVDGLTVAQVAPL